MPALQTISGSAFLKQVESEFSKTVVGQEETIRKFLITLLCRGHILLEGVPGIAKTLMSRTLSTILNCSFSRIQFTPDLLPTDITGVMTYNEAHQFQIIKGPVFANLVLADEINRASPKVQSALLEAMQERQVTIAKEPYPLPNPFMVIATMNPLENLGTYNLPEAQLDRFLFKIEVSYPSEKEEQEILEQNISLHDFHNFKLNKIVDLKQLSVLQQQTEKLFVDESVKKYIVDLVDATRNPKKHGVDLAHYVQLGGSPRASISLFTASRAHAFLNDREYVTPHDVKEVAFDVLRHRLILNYEAQADGISTDEFIKQILKTVAVP